MKSILLIVLLAITASSQTQTTGRIAGTVRDQNGALIPGANVVVSDKTTGAIRNVVTDSAGQYSAAFLSTGVYSIRVEARGFSHFLAENIQVNVTETTLLDVTLVVAPVLTDPVPVKILAPLLRTESPTLGQVFDDSTIRNLPLATRNFTQLLGMATGASTYLTDNTVVGRNSSNVSVNGARVSQNNFQINGIDANAGIGAGLPLANPAPESIAEFKVQTSLYDATFGRAAGANVQIITKVGSNKFSGAVYDYFSDTVLTANNPFLKAVGLRRPVLDRNIFGFVFGGPIKRDKFFFFVSYQNSRELNGASRQNSLSTNILIAPGLTDDRTEATLLSTFGVKAIHPISLWLLNARLPSGQFVIPTPQTANGRYSGSALSRFRDDQFNANFDYRLSQSNLLSVKFFYSDAPQFVARRGLTNVPGFGIDQAQHNRLLAVQDIHVFSPNVTNEARVGYNYLRGDNFPHQPVFDSALGNLRIPRLTASSFPGLGLIRIGRDANGISFGTGVQQDRQTTAPTNSFADTLSVTRGKHNLRFGGEVRYYEFDVTNNLLTRGNIEFEDFSGFLTGRTSLGVLANGVTKRNLRTTDYDLFIQNDWKFSPRLTFNLGFRYELDLPPYDTLGRISTFDASLYRPNVIGGPPLQGIVQAGNPGPGFDLPNVPNVSRRVAQIDANNLTPRVGFAYSMLKSGRAVVRGGYGIFYSRPSFQYLVNNMYLPPFYIINATFGHPTVDAGYPHVPSQSEFPIYPFGSVMFGNSFDRNNRIPYAQQYNASVQFQVSTNSALEVAYVGSRGHNLYRRVGINQAPLASPARPIINQATGEPITINTPQNVQDRAPFRGVIVSSLDIRGFNQDRTTAESHYNSLQVKLTRRLDRGLQLLASYTFSRSIDNASGTGGGSGSSGLIDPGEVGDTGFFVGDQTGKGSNRGVSNFDRPHRLVVSFIWELPKSYVVRRSKIGRLLFSGWRVSGIGTAMSGLPIDVIDLAGSSFYLGAGGGGGRPNWVPGVSPTSDIPPGYYFNPYAFSRAFVHAPQMIPSSNGTASASATGTDFGNVPRNVLRGPGQFNIDLAIAKHFRLSESSNIEFRTEVFNLFNTVNYANPISNFGSVTTTGGFIDPVTGRIPAGRAGDFGKIIATSNNPRIVQISLRFNF